MEHIPRQTFISLNSANVTTQQNVANLMTEIIDVVVPRTLAHKILFGTPIRLFLFTKETFSGSGSSGQVISLAEKLINSPSLSDQAEAVVFVAGVKVANYTVQHDPTNTVTSTGAGFAPGTDNVDVYYIWQSPSVPDDVRIRAADANKEKFSPLMKRNLFSWHGADQNSAKERQEMRNEITLPEKTHLLFELESDVLANFDANSPAFLEFAVLESPMSKVDPASFVKFTE